jgi:RND family efflux transporter MFP subunit
MANAKLTGHLGKIIGLALFAVAAFLLFTYEAPDPEPPPPVVRPAKMLTLETAAEAAKRSFTGRVQASVQADLSFRVSGPLVELTVIGAQEVEEGDLLARIDPRDFEVRVRNVEAQLDRARAALKAAKAGARPEDIVKLEAEVAKADSAYRVAKQEYENFRSAREADPGAVTKLQLQQKQDAMERQEALLRTAQENLRIGQVGARAEDIEALEAEIRALQASYDAAADQLEDTELRAPFAGRIVRVNVENFQDVRAKQPVLSLMETGTVEIVADIPESVALEIRKESVLGSMASFEGIEETFDVEFKEAELEADRRTRTFAATFTMPAPEDRNILPGMSSTVQLELDPAAAVEAREWLVPADAVVADEAGEPGVWVVDLDTMKVSRRPIETGDLRDDRIAVTSGLAAGDTIVIAGVRLLTEGMEVREMEGRAK